MKRLLFMALALAACSRKAEPPPPATGGGMDGDPNAQAIRSARASEPRTLLPKIGEFARVYSMEARVAQGGGELPRGFPVGSAGPTPPYGSCCQYPDGMCPPSQAQWSGMWSQLNFAVGEPSPYSYSYQSDGRRFTATANGDLDCDGVYSTFTLYGEMLNDEPSIKGMSMSKDLE